MRKIYSFFAFALMMVVSLAADAWSFDLPTENEVLQNETFNMRLFKTWDFINMTVNGNAIGATYATGDAADNLQKTDGYTPVKITTEGMDGWYMGIGNIEFNVDKGGLYNNKNGIRYVIFDGLKAGQIVCIQSGGSNVVTEPNIETNTHVFAANCIRCQKASTDGTIAAWTCSYLSNNGAEDVVQEITDSIHAIQNKGAEYDEEGNIVSGGADSYRYFKVLIDGALYMAMGKYASIQGMQIWIDANAEESVSAPSYKMFSVSGEARNIELVSGESTFGAACSVTYGIMENEDATNEDQEYDPSVGYFSVSSSDDEDGDGYVTVEAVTVSENGVKSEPVDFKIAVGEITLNAPTLTLYGFSGEERVYTIGWTNNTLCGEAYTITVDADGGEKHNEFEPSTGIGENITFTSDATVTVSVNGYNDGVYTITAENQGVAVTRKNAEKSANGEHDWDFVNLTNRQKALIKQDASLDSSIIINCYTVKVDGEVADTTYYSAKEYTDGVAADGTDLSEAVPVLEASGWATFDTSKNRTSLNVVEGGNDQNSDGYGYADDAAKIWDGLQVSNPPYLNSANNEVASILLYINDDLGLYMGTKPTFTFPREAATAGEYVLMYIGYGGSNYTNSRYPVIYQVPEGELLTVTLGNNPHVFYIDVYTYEGLPEDTFDPVNIKNVSTKTAVQPIEGYYSLNGAKLAAPAKGINIVKYADGTTMKILVK